MCKSINEWAMFVEEQDTLNTEELYSQLCEDFSLETVQNLMRNLALFDRISIALYKYTDSTCEQVPFLIEYAGYKDWYCVK